MANFSRLRMTNVLKLDYDDCYNLHQAPINFHYSMLKFGDKITVSPPRRYVKFARLDVAGAETLLVVVF